MAVKKLYQRPIEDGARQPGGADPSRGPGRAKSGKGGMRAKPQAAPPETGLAGGAGAGISQAKMGKPWETAGRKAMGAKARRRYAGPAANYEKQTVGNRGAQSYGG